MKDKILKLLYSSNIQDNLLAFSLIVDNYDPKSFFRSLGSYKGLKDSLIYRARESILPTKEKYVYVVNKDFCIYTDDYFLFFEMNKPEQAGIYNIKTINH